MYSWDLELIKDNQRKIYADKKKYSIPLFNEHLNHYNILYEYIDGIPPCEIDYTDTDDEYYSGIAKYVHKNMRESKIMTSKLLLRLINQEIININTKEHKIDLEFSEDEVVENIYYFFANLNSSYSYMFENLIRNKELLLKKDVFTNGTFIKGGLNDSVYIGVISPNIEDMMFALTHEFGHYINSKNGLKGASNNETIPILLELFLFDYLKNSKKNYDILPYIQERLITKRNINIVTLKTYYDTYYSTDEDYTINKIKELSALKTGILDFNVSLDYYLSTLRALDFYRKSNDKDFTIKEIINSDKSIQQIHHFLDITNPDVLSEENIKLIKRLVR